jgi:hypothetical protein
VLNCYGSMTACLFQPAQYMCLYLLKCQLQLGVLCNDMLPHCSVWKVNALA